MNPALSTRTSDLLPSHLDSLALTGQVQIASTGQELEALERFRYQIYVTEQGKHVAGADSGRRRLQLESDRDAVHYFLRSPDQEHILGYVRGHFGIFPSHLHEPFQLGRFERFCTRGQLYFSSQLMVSRTSRNFHVMRALTGAQYRHGRQKGIKAWLFHCRAALTVFYTRSGMYRYGPLFELPDLGWQAPCIGICEDVQHFAQTKSYFFPLSQEFENSDDFRAAFFREFGATLPKEQS